MRRLLSIFTTVVLWAAGAVGQDAVGYQWWFDSDTLAMRSGEFTGGRLTIAEDMDGMPYGVHYFNIRLQDSDGVWGAPYRKSFLTVENSNGASAYEYWIDNDYENKGTGNINTGSDSFSIDISGLPTGLHHLNIRLRTNGDEWGSIYRKTFLSTPNESGAVAYEYWIDDNYAARKEGAVVAGDNVYEVSLQGIRKGLHRFSYRMKTSDGKWGAVYARHFYYTAAGNGFDYEYWFDNDHANAVSGRLASGAATFNIDMGNLPQKESHAFNMRVRDDDGEWGSIYRKLLLFYDNPLQVPLKGYRHSLNGEDLGYVTIENNPQGTYAFTVDLPDGAGFDMAEMPVSFNGDVLSVADTVPIDYRIQMESKIGWGPVLTYNFDFEVTYSTTAEPIEIPSTLQFRRPARSEFKAVKFVADGNRIYLGIDHQATIDIYRDGKKTLTITEEELAATKQLDLPAGTYYAAIFNVKPNPDDTGNPEEQVTLRLTQRRNTTPVLKGYDGRYAELEAGAGETILYTIDGSDPLTNGTAYAEAKVDMGGIGATLRAVSVREDYDNSPELTFTTEYYADDTDLYTSAPHQAAQAYGWKSDLSDMERLTAHGTLCDGTAADNTDYRWIMTHMAGLKHIDLRDISDRTLPDNALNSASLLTAVMPAEMTAAGEYIFGENNRTLCAIEIPAATIAPANLLKGVANPNLIGYVAEKRYASPLAELQNVVYGRDLKSDGIALSHGSPLFIPKGFTAEKISYTREFTRQTSVDGFGSGWETMAVPFDVETVKNGDTELEPFAKTDRQGKPFWLYRADGTGWEHTDKIEANTPYLTAMPNNPWYADDFNVAGTVTFSATNAGVPATPEEDIAESFGGGSYIHVNYSHVAADGSVYALNDTETVWNGVTFLPGSIFERGAKDVVPFECHVSSAGGARYVKIFDGSGAGTLHAVTGLKIWTEGSDICIRSGLGLRLPIHDTVGNLVRIAEAKAGETTRVSGLTPGIYIAGHSKLLVK